MARRFLRQRRRPNYSEDIGRGARAGGRFFGGRATGGGRGQCRVGAADVSASYMLAIFFIIISHCPWRDFISWSFGDKKRSKENAFPQSVLSVPGVHASAFGSRVERCSLERRMFEPFLLANPDIPTLRHQWSQARSVARRPLRPHASPRSGGPHNPRGHLGEGRA
jgi:hypothetical protein